MKRVWKVFLSLGLLCTIVSHWSPSSVGAKSLSITDGVRIETVFPDAKIAKKIATQLNKGVEDSIAQVDLDSITSFVMVTGGSGVESIEGMQYLRNLNNLLIYGTDITSLPEGMSQLTKLKSLQLNANALTNVPSWVSNLKNLEKLTFFQNKIETFDADLSGMEQLKTFMIYDNNLTELNCVFPTSLEELDVHGNELTTLGDNFILPNLKKLNAHDNNLTSLNLRLDELTSLTELSINNNAISSRVPNVALKPGQIDKWSLANHTQVVTNSDISIYKGQGVHGSDLLCDFLLQLEADKQASGSSLNTYGTWAIKEVGSYTSTYVNYVDGSEINDSLFTIGKAYDVEFIATNSSMREWGYSSYKTTIYFEDKERSSIDFLLHDMDGNILSSETIDGFVGESFTKDVLESYESGGDIYEFAGVEGAEVVPLRANGVKITGTHISGSQNIILKYKKVIVTQVEKHTSNAQKSSVTTQASVKTMDTKDRFTFILLALGSILSVIILSKRQRNVK